ncbi:hypothetical protein F980_00005 [Acinetobacter lwoffii NIPH 715]|nr:hypothetical protein F980_00005 [Acinetobacter lwoffii NIPH 715]
MSKILELEQKAQSLLDKHQSDIDKKLNSEMRVIFNDTERTLSEKAQSLMTSIDTTQTSIQEKQSESTAKITQQIEQNTRKILSAHNKQLEQFTADQQAKLAQLNSLSTEIANHSKIRDTIFQSNTVLISIACIALIFGIAMSVISYVKYMQIQDRNQQIVGLDKAIQSKTNELVDLYTQIYNIEQKRK